MSKCVFVRKIGHVTATGLVKTSQSEVVEEILLATDVWSSADKVDRTVKGYIGAGSTKVAIYVRSSSFLSHFEEVTYQVTGPIW
jgi:hypothetical protein